MGHVAAPEPSSARKWVQICWTRGGTGALLGREAGSRAVGHMTTHGSRQGSELWDTWQHMVARPTLCLGLMPVCGGTRSAGYQQHSLSVCCHSRQEQ
jgi:hypothetical protein